MGPFRDFPFRFLDTHIGARIAERRDNKPLFPAGGGTILSAALKDFSDNESKD